MPMNISSQSGALVNSHGCVRRVQTERRSRQGHEHGAVYIPGHHVTQDVERVSFGLNICTNKVWSKKNFYEKKFKILF